MTERSALVYQSSMERSGTGNEPLNPAHDPLPLVAGIAVWRPWRGPFERWPNLTDLIVALVAFLLTLMMVWSSQLDETAALTVDSTADLIAFQCAFVGNFALLWRRSHAWQVQATVLAVSIILYVTGSGTGIIALAPSLYSLGRHEPNHRASLAGISATLAVYISLLFLIQQPSVQGTISVMMMLVLWYTGRRLRFRGEYLRLLEERAQHLERERNVESERAVVAERSRIARELHDVVAHQVSLMTIQAGAARTISVSDPKAASEAIAAVESAGRHALKELRHLLNVMRPADEPYSLVPQPGIDRLPELIDQVRDAGLSVQLHTRGDLAELSLRLQLTIYRIVQEAITNVIKHAGTEAHADVLITGHLQEIAVTIKDNGKMSTQDKTSSGHGITGMRERVELLGGTFSAGACSDGGFEVRAVIPRSVEKL